MDSVVADETVFIGHAERDSADVFYEEHYEGGYDLVDRLVSWALGCVLGEG